MQKHEAPAPASQRQTGRHALTALQSSSYGRHPRVLPLAPKGRQTFNVYAMVVEVPAALVIDTLAYPFDRNAVSRFKAGPGIFENTLFSETESAHAEPETLRRHYWPTACAPIIKQFLARQEMLTGQRAKIMLLIEAGAGLPFLADQALLDNEAAATLFSAAANMAEVRGKLLARIDNRAMIA